VPRFVITVGERSQLRRRSKEHFKSTEHTLFVHRQLDAFNGPIRAEDLVQVRFGDVLSKLLYHDLHRMSVVNSSHLEPLDIELE